MKGLSQQSRALLAEARRSEHLSPLDKARIRSNLTRRIGAGLALGTALTASATVAEAAHTGAFASFVAWLPAVTKAVSVIAITGAVSFGVVKATRTSSPATLASTPAVTASSVPPRVQAPARSNAALTISTAAARSETRTTDSAETLPRAEPLKRNERVDPNPVAPRNRRSVVKPSDEVRSPVEHVVAEGLTNQVAAIRTARAAIREGDPWVALTILDREMPEGRAAALAPEAALARVAAYCRLGQIEAARRTAERFQLQYPQSPVAARLRESCAGAAVAQP